jgi:hypothetical protein
MIGMVAFIVDVPVGFPRAVDRSGPVQIFMWAALRKPGFAGRRPAHAIIVAARPSWSP